MKTNTKKKLKETQNKNIAIEENQHSVILNGLGCASCAVKIEEKIRKEEDFEKVEFSFATKKLQVESNLSKEELKKSIQKIVDDIEDGVQVAFEKSEVKTSKKKQDILYHLLKKNAQMLLGMFLLLGIFLLPLSKNIQISFYILPYVLVGSDVFIRAIRNLRKKNFFDEYFLMTIATIGAFFIGQFTEAVLVMFFYKIGENFQDYAVDYSRKSINALLNIKAEYANLLEKDISKKVSPEALEVGNFILVRAGEKIPVDGKVVEGTSYVDTSALTGESMPRNVDIGDEVLAGMINQERVIKVEVMKAYKNSTVARILEMVEKATSKKAKTEQFITKFAKIYTPIVVALALILAILPPMIGFGDFREWISRALIFLVISCPCALVLSVPLAYFAGLGKASKKGILIKGGNYLEALNGIDTFVFDKTGTLTKGNFRVVHVTDKETLRLAAIIERYSTHPIAKSIQEAYGETIYEEQVNEIKEIPGEGLQGIYQNKSLLVGNERLMARHGISVENIALVGTVLYVAYEEKYFGVIQIADEIREGVSKLVHKLKEMGAKEIIMLTGDQENIAAKVAVNVGVDRYFSQLMPQDKLLHVEEIIEKGSKVLFVGDGINDAPVLVRSNIGVAMGGLGSDAAIEAADMVLMTDEPEKLLEALAIAKKTKKIVIGNIVFALSVKVFFLTLGAFGIASMYEAIFADVGVAIIAVLNAMRILKK